MSRSLVLGSLRTVSALVVAGAAALAQSIWYVDSAATPPGLGTSASPFASIQYAIDRPATVNGDTLVVAPGTYVENLAYHGKNIVIRSSSGAGATLLTPAAAGPVAHLSGDMSSAVLEGFTITGLLPGTIWPDAAVVLFSGSLRRCIVRDNDQGTGIGVLSMYDGELTHCTVTRNTFGVLAQSSVAIVSMRNTITWGNSQTDLDVAGGLSDVRYCAGGLAGQTNDPSNVYGDPQLWNLGTSDFHLAPLSRCIDAGDPAWPLDPDGSRADIGAIPYDANYAATPTVYCTPKINSKGCAPSVSSSGTASLSGADDFVLTTTALLNKKNGSYIWSYAPKATPFAGGTLCIKLPLVRGTPLNTGGNPTGLDCSGSFGWHFSQTYMAQKNVPAGAIVYAQAWARDSGFAAPDNSQFSDAIVFSVGP